MIRAETAAATRQALLEAAAELLDQGGLEAVTLRAVGARAGVTRGAPYRHFPDKERLMIAVGAQAWDELGQQIGAVRRDPGLAPAAKLQALLAAFINVARRRPHLYRLMFSSPAGDPTAFARAAQPTQDESLQIVAALTGEQDARRYAALLLASADGIAGMELTGQLGGDKWRTTAEELIDTLVTMVADQTRAGR
ncbi:TetR/AcrR family transcriptional regulator [Paractinoplanes brasiliensis]|uniref:TetR family transcriptional regulator n=1 Tax=Paractinoplanes brasiliensis TaxID=52695 RepID=A0A4V3C690_9ACTN|nr:TetR/AcrR family transcriptional regulator [Actinoplanes brasiliensis]TDO32798.1 TetR family transcriptional regulator [Actinoplanes brasiliensis]GID31657.1 TetR family transcriptional regulator [Actinoplanes brasiliensis]